MGKGRVLVIDGDDWVARLLADGLRDHGFDVSTCLSGAEALGVAQTIAPDCVVSEMMLPELDGPSIARALRSDSGVLARVPILFLSNADDVSSRKSAFGAGGDVYLTKPFRVDEIAMQVQALVLMAGRIVGRRDAMVSLDVEDSDPESISPGGHAIEGNIAQMSVATVLTLLEMERRSGTLKVTQVNRSCSLDIIGGYAIGATIDDSKVAPLAVLREILRWQEGRFRFRPGSDGAIPSNRRSIGALLIEAVRLDDESTHARELWAGSDEASTARRSWPVLPQQAVPSSKRIAPQPVARRLSRPPPPARASKPPLARVSKPPPARASKPPPPATVKPAPPRPGLPRRAVRPAAPPPPTRKKP